MRDAGLGHAALRWVWAHPWLVAAIAGIIGCAVDPRDVSLTPVDFPLFASAGEHLLHLDLDAVFSDPQVQSGPVTLVFIALIARAATFVGHPAVPFLAMSLTASLAMTAAIRVCVRPRSTEWAGGALLTALALAAAWGVFTGTWGHPSHALVPLVWTYAVVQLQRGNAAAAGALLGVAVAVDPWALIGLGAAAIVLPDLRRVARVGLVMATVVGLAWAPLVVAGPLRTGEHRWPVAPGTVPAMAGWDDVGAGYRVAQAALLLATGAITAFLMRRNAHLPWVFPIVLIGGRVVTDGLYFEYYAIPVLTGTLVGLAVLMGAKDRQAPMTAVAAFAVAWSLHGAGGVVAELPLVMGVILAVLAAHLSQRTATRAGSRGTIDG